MMMLSISVVLVLLLTSVFCSELGDYYKDKTNRLLKSSLTSSERTLSATPVTSCPINPEPVTPWNFDSGSEQGDILLNTIILY